MSTGTRDRGCNLLWHLNSISSLSLILPSGIISVFSDGLGQPSRVIQSLKGSWPTIWEPHSTVLSGSIWIGYFCIAMTKWLERNQIKEGRDHSGLRCEVWRDTVSPQGESRMVGPGHSAFIGSRKHVTHLKTLPKRTSSSREWGSTWWRFYKLLKQHQQLGIKLSNTQPRPDGEGSRLTLNHITT